MVILHLTFWGTTKPFSRVAIPFYIPISRVPVFPHPLQHLLFSFFGHACSSRCEVVSHCILICISLRTNCVEHLFMCLLVLCLSSLEECLLKPFVHLWIGLLVFCCWVVGGFSFLGGHILSINPFSDIWFANVFSHFVGALFTLLIMYSCAPNFLSW